MSSKDKMVVIKGSVLFMLALGISAPASAEPDNRTVEVEATCLESGDLQIETYVRDDGGPLVLKDRALLPTNSSRACQYAPDNIRASYRSLNKTAIIGRCDADGVYHRYAILTDGMLAPLAPATFGNTCYLLEATHARNQDQRPIRWTFICDPVGHLIVNTFDEASGSESPVYLVRESTASRCGDSAHTLQRFKGRETQATAFLPDSTFKVHRIMLDVEAGITEYPPITTSHPYYAVLYRENDRVQDQYPGPRPTFYTDESGQLWFDVFVNGVFREPVALASAAPGALEDEARLLNSGFPSLVGVRQFAFCDGATLHHYRFDAMWRPRLVSTSVKIGADACRVERWRLTDRTTATMLPYTE